MSAPTIRRRALAGSAASLLLVGATEAGQAKAQELDGELLRRCSEFIALEARYRRLLAAEDRLPIGREKNTELDRQLASIGEVYTPSLDAIAELPARTPEGLQAKAAVVRAFYEPDPPGADGGDRVAWSIICDMVGRA